MTRPALLTRTLDTPLGAMLLAASPQGLAGAWFCSGQRDTPDASGWTTAPASHPVLSAAATQLAQYFADERTAFELPLDLSAGTAFQQRVWRALLALPWGQTCSYGALAQQIGQPQAVRALGGAVGRNPISIIVPCHRVLGAKGALTGYSGGLERKVALLQREGLRL